MKTEFNRDNEALFNNMAHETVRQILNIAEDRLLQKQVSDPVEIEEFLCRAFIEQTAGIIQGGSWFLQSDATVGAEIFLLKCLDTFTGKPHRMRRRLTPVKLETCGRQLSIHTLYYFPRFHAILTQRYIEELQQPDDAALVGASWNGVFHLAAASLPGVKEEINRELRRRGLGYDAAKVPVNHFARRMRAIGKPAPATQGNLS